MSQEESNVVVMHPELKSTLDRDIIAIFHLWHNEDALPFERIRAILIENGQLKDNEGSKRWLREKLKRLRAVNILIDVKLPCKKKAGRPPLAYKLNENVIYELFKLTEDLVDAMGFAQIKGESEPGKAFVERHGIITGEESRSLIHNYLKSGYLGFAYRLANEEDFEKTRMLASHIKILQRYCKTDSSAYKKYHNKREDQEMRRQAGIIGMWIPEGPGKVLP